ncbi:hypothetical protein FXO38_21865 [Capsicum annuum]|nr:hypothetical protein FXO37_28402 [Capsicum annuum]KAF3640961.1 hypothetical protein FXO38_21865 [Capsicum annuum]
MKITSDEKCTDGRRSSLMLQIAGDLTPVGKGEQGSGPGSSYVSTKVTVVSAAATIMAVLVVYTGTKAATMVAAVALAALLMVLITFRRSRVQALETTSGRNTSTRPPGVDSMLGNLQSVIGLSFVNTPSTLPNPISQKSTALLHLNLHVASIKVIHNKQTGFSEGYGFVEFFTHASAEKLKGASNANGGQNGGSTTFAKDCKDD